MNLVTGIISLLAVSSASFALDFSRFLWTAKPSKTTEEVQVIEMIKWRQPICLMPAEGVSPCLHEFKKFQHDYEQFSGKEAEVESSGWIKSETLVSTPPVSPEFLTETSSYLRSTTVEVKEDEERDIKEGRHLSLNGEKKKSQHIYVTKVLSSPTTATLVAYGCVPDIGVPLCPNYPATIQPSRPFFSSRPAMTVSVGVEPPRASTSSPNGNLHQGFKDKPSGSVQQTLPGPQIVIRRPSSEELATKFGLEDAKTETKLQVREPGSAKDPEPSTGFLGVEDQPAKVELSMDSGSETLKTSEVAARKDHRIFQKIRDIVDKTESKIVQTVQNILRRPSGQKIKDSSGMDNGTAVMDSKKAMDNGDATSDEKNADGLHKPLMDGSKPGTESKKTQDLLGSDFANPVGPEVKDGTVGEAKNDGS